MAVLAGHSVRTPVFAHDDSGLIRAFCFFRDRGFFGFGFSVIVTP